MNTYIKYFIFFILLTSCKENLPKKESVIHSVKVKDTFKIYTKKVINSTIYMGFDAANAINKIADIENEYFNSFSKKGSKYYGTIWRENAEYDFINDSISTYQRYVDSKSPIKPDSMHCTIYAMEAIKAGFKTKFDSLQKLHIKHYKNHEHAGWSVAYILTKYYNWKAYLFLDINSPEYERCVKNYKKEKSYHVWRRPNISIEKLFHRDRDSMAIIRLLQENTFGFGFSEQGIHTWITRNEKLKECYWEGSPSSEYSNEPNLFLKTPFLEYQDYGSHIIVFPPKLD